MGSSNTCLRQEVEDFTALQSRCYDGEDSVHKTAARGSISPEATLSAEFCWQDGLRRRVVRRLDELRLGACPQRGKYLEDDVALALGLGLAAASSIPKQIFDLIAEGAHVHSETGLRDGPITIQPLGIEHQVDLYQKDVADSSGPVSSFGEALIIPDHLRPADLTMAQMHRFVALPAVRLGIPAEAPLRAQPRFSRSGHGSRTR